MIVAFVRSSGELAQRLPELAERTFSAGRLWIAWPRRAAGHVSDVTDNVVREHVLPLGLVDVKVAAIDEDWSAYASSGGSRTAERASAASGNVCLVDDLTEAAVVGITVPPSDGRCRYAASAIGQKA